MWTVSQSDKMVATSGTVRNQYRAQLPPAYLKSEHVAFLVGRATRLRASHPRIPDSVPRWAKTGFFSTARTHLVSFQCVPQALSPEVQRT